LGTSFVDPRNQSLKTLMALNRTHDLRSNGTWELPFGPNRPLLANAPPIVQRMVERWQLGGVFSINSGAPLTLTASASTYGIGNAFPDMLVNLPKNAGAVTRTSVPGVVTYFDGWTQVTDPGKASVTPLQSLQGADSNFAIADSEGRIILANPTPGKIGNMGQSYLSGPGAINMDANLVKRVRVGEGREMVVRLDAVNILNHPNWAAPNTSINSTSFGRIALPTTGNRQFTFTARFEF